MDPTSSDSDDRVAEHQLAADEREKEAQVMEREGLEQELMEDDRSEVGERLGDEVD